MLRKKVSLTQFVKAWRLTNKPWPSTPYFVESHLTALLARLTVRTITTSMQLSIPAEQQCRPAPGRRPAHLRSEGYRVPGVGQCVQQRRQKPMKVGRCFRTTVSTIAAWLAPSCCVFAASRVASQHRSGRRRRSQATREFADEHLIRVGPVEDDFVAVFRLHRRRAPHH